MNCKFSLIDFVGLEFIQNLAVAREKLTGIPQVKTITAASRKVEFFSQRFQAQQDALLKQVGKQVMPPYKDPCSGAASSAFASAFHGNMAPLFAQGLFRVGTDGRLYLIGKSEHYQASLGHHFPGFKLLQTAEELGITNITHNNTRGHITRLAERELVRIANGLSASQTEELNQLCQGKPGKLCRVINLETGSLVMEAAVKMMLARFYRLHGNTAAPKYEGKIPVFLVMADHGKGPEANYHGTTIFTQMFRGMWPDMAQKSSGLFKVRPVTINDYADFQKAVTDYDKGKYKVAGFLHELVLMNYGALELDKKYIQLAYDLCAKHDIPTAVDEIQTGIWSPKLFLFKEYGISPSFVSVGKGFPGGIYPASKLIFTPEMDNLDQFGALVTNGQEELASLSYLITMRYAESIEEKTEQLGAYLQAGLAKLARKHKGTIAAIDGRGLLAAIRFDTPEKAASFASAITHDRCIDISAQTYKAHCPPAALLKLPLISTTATIDYLLKAIDLTLRS